MTKLLGVELLVESIERAVEILVNVLGGELVQRESASALSGQMAMVRLDTLLLTVVEPSSYGPGPILADRSPRMTQLVLGESGIGAVAERHHLVTEAGLATSRLGDTGFFITPESVAGALGFPLAIVCTDFDDATESVNDGSEPGATSDQAVAGLGSAAPPGASAAADR